MSWVGNKKQEESQLYVVSEFARTFWLQLRYPGQSVARWLWLNIIWSSIQSIGYFYGTSKKFLWIKRLVQLIRFYSEHTLSFCHFVFLHALVGELGDKKKRQPNPVSIPHIISSSRVIEFEKILLPSSCFYSTSSSSSWSVRCSRSSSCLLMHCRRGTRDRVGQ